MYCRHMIWGMAAVLGVGTASADEAFVTTRSLNTALSHKLVAATELACAKRGLQVSVAVTDRYGNLQAFLRNPLAGMHTVNVAMDKAYTAATFQSPTLELAKQLNFLRGTPRITLVGGGVPVRSGGYMYGAVGVSGAPREKQPGDIDEACAREGIAAIQEELDFAGQ